MAGEVREDGPPRREPEPSEESDVEEERREKAARAERTALDARQSSMKILINSFYGYLAYNRALFNDYRAADAVTFSISFLMILFLGVDKPPTFP